ncbi:MAG: hypothetical protein ACFB14_00425 [Leptolyngbyaceae cyanobacterium]
MSLSTTPTLKARNQIRTMFLVLLILDAVLIALTADLWAIGRILFTAVIMVFTLQGHQWAKWLLIGILSLVVVALIGLLVALGAELSMVVSVGSVVMAILSCVIIGYLVSSRELKQYFTQKQPKKT